MSAETVTNLLHYCWQVTYYT